MRASRVTSAVPAVLIPPLAGVVAWFLIGDLTDLDPAAVEGGLDHVWRAPDLPGWLGIAAAVLLAAALIALALEGDDREVPGWVWGAVCLLSAAAVLAAWAGRIMSAGVIGANIGAGLAVMLLGPVIAALVIGAGVTALAGLLRSRRPA